MISSAVPLSEQLLYPKVLVKDRKVVHLNAWKIASAMYVSGIYLTTRAYYTSSFFKSPNNWQCEMESDIFLVFAKA